MQNFIILLLVISLLCVFHFESCYVPQIIQKMRVSPLQTLEETTKYCFDKKVPFEIAATYYYTVGHDNYNKQSILTELFSTEKMSKAITYFNSCVISTNPGATIKINNKNMPLLEDILTQNGCYLPLIHDFTLTKIIHDYQHTLNVDKLLNIAIKSNPYAIFMVNYNNVYAYYNYIIMALQTDGNVLFGFPNLQNDKRFVEVAIKNNGLAIRYASQQMKETQEIVCIAIAQNSDAVKFIAESLKHNISNICASFH